MRLLLISDTHLPSRARDMPAEVWAAVEVADVVFHAGDWIEVELLDRLSDRARQLIACWGNNDGDELRARLPERADIVLDGLHFTVTHETGAAAGRDNRMARAYPDTDVLVFGHSHIPWDTTVDKPRRDAAVAQSRLTHRPPTAAALHLYDGRNIRRRAGPGRTAQTPPIALARRYCVAVSRA